MIYLDNNATTQPDPAVVDAMLPWLTRDYANASASHAGGRRAHRALEAARAQVAALVGARSAEEIIFTSCATESVNSVHACLQEEWRDGQGPVLVTGRTEHAVGLECAERWEQRGGEVRWIGVDRQGMLDLAALQAALKLTPGRRTLVSLLWANNETGVVTPMAEVVALAHAAGALVHADAVQAAGKIPVDVQAVPVDYLSLSGHKVHAPKGVGALYVNRGAPFRPLLIGGGQEGGRRSGTENIPGIVALGKAAELAAGHLADDPRSAAVAQLRAAFEQELRAALPEMRLAVHGAGAARLPNTSSVGFPGVDAAGLLILLDQKGVACSGGSACHAGALHPSHVLEAMGYDAAHAASTVRFSLSRLNTLEEVMTAAGRVVAAVKRLRALKDEDAGPVVLA